MIGAILQVGDGNISTGKAIPYCILQGKNLAYFFKISP
jgi:hypothetical protein